MADEAPSAAKGERKFASGEKPAKDDGGAGLTADQSLLVVMRKRFGRSMAKEGDNRKRWDTDTKFLVAEDQSQWDATVKAVRAKEGRPVLQFNLLPKFFFQVANEIRQNSPGFSVKPEQGEATPEAATVLEGMLRHINNRSMGDEARQTACDQAIAGGFGYYGVTTQHAWEDIGKLELPGQTLDEAEDTDNPDIPEGEELSDEQESALFAQEIRIRHIPNALACHDDPDAKLPDRSDRRFFFIEDMLPREDFEARYPEAEQTGFAGTPAPNGEFAGWWSANDIRTVEYWWIEETWRTVYGKRGKDGKRRSRRAAIRKVKWAICSAYEVLERGDWAGKYIPFIRIDGWRMNLNGKVHVEGLIHQAMDPQVAFNYMRTAHTERIGLQALAPWVLAEGQEVGHEMEWQTANSATNPYLRYRPTSLDGVPIGRPERLDPPPPSADLISAAQAAKEDVYDGMRMSPPAVGQASATPTLGQEKLRILESDQGNYHFIQSLKTGIGFEGRIIKDLVPKIYDTNQQVRILGEDGSARMITLNPPLLEGMKPAPVLPMQEPDGAGGTRTVEAFNLGVGEYDVTVQMGPAFNTQQDAAKSDMLELMKLGGPQALMILGPFWARMSNLKERETIAKMLEALYPPQLQAVLMAERQGAPDKMQVGQLRAALAQSVNMLQSMQGVVQQLQAKVQDKQADRALKMMETAIKEETKRLGGVFQLTGQSISAEAKLMETGIKADKPETGAAAADAVSGTKAAGLAQADAIHDQTRERLGTPNAE